MWNREMLVANNFPKMMARCAGYMAAPTPPAKQQSGAQPLLTFD